MWEAVSRDVEPVNVVGVEMVDDDGDGYAYGKVDLTGLDGRESVIAFGGLFSDDVNVDVARLGDVTTLYPCPC